MNVSASEATRRARARQDGRAVRDEDMPGDLNDFDARLYKEARFPLTACDMRTVQVNISLICNQSCNHCHLGCSPSRTEQMDWETMLQVCSLASPSWTRLVDITGGEPSLHPLLPQFIETLRERGLRVQVRTNFTALLEKSARSLPEFFRDHEVQLVGSMPCYMQENVDAQRGPGTYERSIESIRRLNALGYGRSDRLQLNLVYNPAGPVLPPEQAQLEADYRRELRKSAGVEFTNLLTIANMPIGRFQAELDRRGCTEQYGQLLRESFNRQTLDALMCRHQISIRWDGTLFDCDFNVALDCPVDHGAPKHLLSFDMRRLVKRRVVTGEHCFGCTAGSGSSCGGTLV